MNLIYISNLSNNIDAGLNWSVPASVCAQQQYDNVLWIDLTKGAFQQHWSEVQSYHNLDEFGNNLCLNNLPNPFNKPDCVIFEGFYYISHVKFSKELLRANIPYIIIPRGSLTALALHNGGIIKYLKKWMAHLLIFNSYIKNAKAIQYLTNEERVESEKRYRSNSFVLPNGIKIPEVYKNTFSNDIKAIFIGRQDIYQKGIDLLLESIQELHQELSKARFKLDIYGPPRYDVKRITALINQLGIEDLVINHEKGIRGIEKQEKLLQSDIFFLTSRFEGHPMGLIEALSYGLPVFITRGANMVDEIQKNKAGWTCETTKRDIVNALRKMIQEKDQFANYGFNARNLSKAYDWNALASIFHTKLINLLSTH